MHTIGWLLILSLLGLAWWNALGARTRARRAARRACKRAGVLFIDELALRRMRLGLAGLKRVYGFEFIVRGDLRYAGEVTVHGQHVVAVRMDPYPFEAEQ